MPHKTKFYHSTPYASPHVNNNFLRFPIWRKQQPAAASANEPSRLTIEVNGPSQLCESLASDLAI